MQIHKLDTNSPRDVEKFVRFPFELYRDCPQWVPPMIADMRLVMNRDRHPFYRHSTAGFFLAEHEGQIQGRIAAIDNRNYNAFHGSRTAFFYFFDAVDDREVSRALFGAVFDWARGRGLDQVEGPKGLVGADGAGILVEGFEHRPAMGIPYNYAYYEALAVDSGMEKSFDHLSGYIARDHQLPQRLFDIAERVKATRGFWIKSFGSKKELRGWVQRIGQVVNESFSTGPGYCPLTTEEVRMAGDQLLAVADPRLIKIVMKGEEIAGFVFGFPDLSVAMQKSGGRLWPFGWLLFLREYRRTRWANINGLGLLPQYQGLGANAVLYTELARTLGDFQFEHGDIVQVGEENFKSRSDMETMGIRWYKRHRTYVRRL